MGESPPLALANTTYASSHVLTFPETQRLTYLSSEMDPIPTSHLGNIQNMYILYLRSNACNFAPGNARQLLNPQHARLCHYANNCNSKPVAYQTRGIGYDIAPLGMTVGPMIEEVRNRYGRTRGMQREEHMEHLPQGINTR